MLKRTPPEQQVWRVQSPSLTSAGGTQQASQRLGQSQNATRARTFKAQKAIILANRSTRSKLGWKTRTAEEITLYLSQTREYLKRGTKWITDGTPK